jgi:GSH-dependent disulfide-bond oxidoreductase
MIRFYYHPTPNPAKVALFLEETGLRYEVVPVDTAKGQQHTAEFRAINPNGKVPAIIDTDGPGGAETRVFDSTAILLYLGEKTGKLMGSPADRGELLSWLFFIATGFGPFSGQAVHFQRAAPEKLPYAINRYRREAERHYTVLDQHLAGREFIVGNEFTIRRHFCLGLDRPRVFRAARQRRSARRLSQYPPLVPGDRRTPRSRQGSGCRQLPHLQEGSRRRDAACAFPVELPAGSRLRQAVPTPARAKAPASPRRKPGNE